MLLGELGGRSAHRKELLEGGKFIPKRPLDKKSSVLESMMAQVRALEQILLPRDEEILEVMPSTGLHIALKSYLLRGAMLEHELFSRLTYAQTLRAEFEKALAEEREAREVAKKRVVALEAERNSSDGRWHREMKMMDDIVKGLQGHRTKQSAMIAKLEEISRHQQGIVERDNQIKYLAEEVESEKRHRLEAQECSRSDRLAAHNLKLDLEEERSAHQTTRATVQALEVRRAFLESEAYEAEVMGKYRYDPVRKVEVSLACKAGFDYLLALLPPESRPAPNSL